jgi:hypothetical protein
MTFDNSRRIVSARLVLFLATFPFLAFIALAYVAHIISFPLLGMGDTFWLSVFAAAYFLIALYPSLLRYNYIYFSDDGNSIILRYYSAGIMKGTKKSVEIPKQSFAGYSTERKFPGIIPYIILNQKRQGSVAKYPPISISALNRRERRRLVQALDLYKSDT